MQSRAAVHSLVWTRLGPVGSVIIPVLQIPIGTLRPEEG